MNIRAEHWKDLGYSRSQLETPRLNIRAGIDLIKRIQSNYRSRSIAEIATLYNDLAAKRVNDYGGRVEILTREKTMVKRKIVADIIGLFGIVLRLLSGIAIIDTELYMNPMDYRYNVFKLAVPFYEIFCITSITFILIRRSLLHEKYILILLGLVFIYSIGIIAFIAFNLEKIPDILFWTVYGIFPFSLFDMIKSICRAQNINSEEAT